METEHLLEEFAPVSAAEWEAAIVRDLKGADPKEKLIWRVEEGLSVSPYYRAEDRKDAAKADAAPGAFPFRRGAQPAGGWRIREEIAETTASEANRAAIAAVAAGAEEIAFTQIDPANAIELELLLKGLDEIPVHFEKAGEPAIRLLLERLKLHPRAADLSTGRHALANVDFAAEIIASAPAGLLPFTVHGDATEEAGATASEEIGLTLAAGVDLLAEFEERGIAIERTAAAIEFAFAIGSEYFIQIAKLRAFRLLWSRVIESFGGSHPAARARIAARTSRWNKTIYDPHVNVLRTTTEAMAAVLGGADSVVVVPFDECYKTPDAASRRLARNTQLLLKHEAGLGRVADAAGGSYYAETLTDLLAEAGWKKLQEIEACGGYRKALAEGTIAHLLEKSRKAREKAVTTRRRTFVGTNQFANPAEQALERIDENRASAGARGTQAYEALRLRTERFKSTGGNLPRIVLAEFGDSKMRAARSTFAANFFACAGLETEVKRCKYPSEIAAAEADLIVLCSSDAEYADMTAQLLPKLKEQNRKTPVIVAGNPEGAEQMKADGVADFVHLRTNPVETLAKWQENLGIKG